MQRPLHLAMYAARHTTALQGGMENDTNHELNVQPCGAVHLPLGFEPFIMMEYATFLNRLSHHAKLQAALCIRVRSIHPRVL